MKNSIVNKAFKDVFKSAKAPLSRADATKQAAALALSKYGKAISEHSFKNQFSIGEREGWLRKDAAGNFGRKRVFKLLQDRIMDALAKHGPLTSEDLRHVIDNDGGMVGVIYTTDIATRLVWEGRLIRVGDHYKLPEPGTDPMAEMDARVIQVLASKPNEAWSRDEIHADVRADGKGDVGLTAVNFAIDRCLKADVIKPIGKDADYFYIEDDYAKPKLRGDELTNALKSVFAECPEGHGFAKEGMVRQLRKRFPHCEIAERMVAERMIAMAKMGVLEKAKADDGDTIYMPVKAPDPETIGDNADLRQQFPEIYAKADKEARELLQQQDFAEREAVNAVKRLAKVKPEHPLVKAYNAMLNCS